MNISPQEAEEALQAVQGVMQKTRRVVAHSGAYNFLLIWGVVWLAGFLGSQFLTAKLAGNLWMVVDILGGILSAVYGYRIWRRVRPIAQTASGMQIGIFWLLLFLYCFAAIWIAQPIDGKQMVMFFILFAAVGWIAMGLLLSFISAWWGAALTILALIGYFLLPGIFYLWMAVLGGGGMIALGLYIRSRW